MLLVIAWNDVDGLFNLLLKENPGFSILYPS